MIIDSRTEFADAVSFANEAGTVNTGNIIDMGLAGRDPGNGNALYLVVTIGTAADGGAATNGTMQFALVSDSTSTISTTTRTVHMMSGALTAAQLPAGKVLVFPVPVEGTAYERYLAFQVIQAVEGEDDCVGNAFLTTDPHGWKAYADGTN